MNVPVRGAGGRFAAFILHFHPTIPDSSLRARPSFQMVPVSLLAGCRRFIPSPTQLNPLNQLYTPTTLAALSFFIFLFSFLLQAEGSLSRVRDI
ncbi:MAG: hypothetical protein IKR48_09500 [Kiritimatiellae bacterium]|nr:hypothetical protein [Kiritimatiellia bacterium]